MWQSRVAGSLIFASSVTGCESRGALHASEISQYGITWKFDHEYRVGQFVNGDWWVVGPVKIVTVTPGPGAAPADEVNDLDKNRSGDTGLLVR